MAHIVRALVCQKSISYVTVARVLIQTFLQRLMDAYMYVHRFFSRNRLSYFDIITELKGRQAEPHKHPIYGNLMKPINKFSHGYHG